MKGIALLILVGLIWVYQELFTAEFYQRMPWQPLDVSAQPDGFTLTKIRRLSDDLPACERKLYELGIAYESLPDRTAGTCTLESQVQLSQSRYPYSAPLKGQCALMLSVALWEKHVVAPAALKYLGEEPTQINHSGIFACRSVRGSQRISEHASANAIDISSFEFDQGSVSLLADWGEDTSKGKFLNAVQQGSCNLFGGVLGPEYNALHRDHFHLDLGNYRICS